MIGTKRYTEIVGSVRSGRKAFQQRRREIAKSSGAVGSDNPGLSNDKHG